MLACLIFDEIWSLTSFISVIPGLHRPFCSLLVCITLEALTQTLTAFVVLERLHRLNKLTFWRADLKVSSCTAPLTWASVDPEKTQQPSVQLIWRCNPSFVLLLLLFIVAEAQIACPSLPFPLISPVICVCLLTAVWSRSEDVYCTECIHPGTERCPPCWEPSSSVHSKNGGKIESGSSDWLPIRPKRGANVRSAKWQKSASGWN